MNDIYSMYPWVPFFKELAGSLVAFRNNRETLLNWLRAELSDVMGRENKKLGFCKKIADASRKDIDPFSVVSILCRKYHFESSEKILVKYQDFFHIKSKASSSDWGLVTFNNDEFLFSNKKSIIDTLWIIFEKVLNDENFSNEYNKISSYKNSHYYLTHMISWICPEKYLALNGPIREFLKSHDIYVNEPPSYERYIGILDQVKYAINNKTIPCNSLLQLTELVQKEGTTSKIWFIPSSKDILVYGSPNLLDLISKHKKKEIELFYNEVIPRTDIIILYETIETERKKYQQLYGWGRFNSKKLRLNSNMLSEIEWHRYVENGIIWDNCEQEGIFKLNSNAHMLENFRIDYQNTTTNMKTNKYQKYIDLLEKNKNLILTGAPGTGKTHIAKSIAAELMGVKNPEKLKEYNNFVQFHPSYDYTDFVEGLRPVEEKGQHGFRRENGVFKDFCKNALASSVNQNVCVSKENAKAAVMIFKQNCNGIELWRSFDKGSGIFTVLTHWDAPIYAVFCIDKYSTPVPVKVSEEKIIEYLTNSQIDSNEKDDYEESIANYINEYILKNKRKYVFIIDEINRGEISKIFGELFFSIDPDYRGEKGIVNTQYQNMINKEDLFYNGFFVPENVYIIGTMNDIDRSVESMDFAMRRRFVFADVTAEKSYQYMIAESNEFTDIEKNEIKQRMFAINDAILKPELRLGEAYQIGAAYFRKYLYYKEQGMEKAFEMLWENHLKGLLFEYLRGNQNAKTQLKELENVFNKKPETNEEADTDNG